MQRSKPPQLAVVLAAGLAAMAGVALLCTLLLWRTHAPAAWIVAAIVAMPLYAVLGYRLGAPAAVAPVLGYAIALAAGTSGADWLAVTFGERVSGISVADAPDHHGAAVFVFSEAETKPRFTGRYLLANGDTTLDYSVVPIVPPGWLPSQPIPAWAGCESTSDLRCTGDRAVPHRAALAVPASQRDRYSYAIDAAELEHKLASRIGAPILRWTATPEALARARGEALWGLAAVVGVAWATAVVALALRRRSAEEA